ncbi:hypothetical protein C2845_PM07G10120 [Panicum miliaceum]|uniref:Uncharacterized protein n=1 Tax=Panicum miliaceum TaxID=4540 RepID=A0A3L6SMZ6_PANMI|nr:hypothetical protein C2845_PM07G10120 [Panicum miliaceum]
MGDLYDLFNVDALDVSLLRCFTLAFNVHCKAMKVDNNSGLQHVTKFPVEFEVRTNTLSQEELHATHEKIANFLMNQVISEKGEFH